MALEAQACGTPVVAAAVGGLPTAVRNGVSGVLVDGHDPRDYAAAVRAVLARRELLSAGARRHAAQFSWDRTADALVDAYASAAAEMAGAPRVVRRGGGLRGAARHAGGAMSRPAGARSIAELDAVIEAALRDGDLVHEHPEPGKWLVDLPGTKKLKTVCGLIVGEHALRVEAFVCRQPDENREQLWTFLLQHNARMYGVSYSIDGVGDVYLTGRLPHAAVTPEELDRILGAVLSYADDHFNAMLEIGFGTSIRREWDWRVKRGESLQEPRGLRDGLRRPRESGVTATDREAPPDEVSPGYARRWWVLATMTVCLLVVIMGNTILNVALPSVQRELGATHGELQWAVDAYILVFAGLLFSWGVIGDRIGRRRVLLIGLTVFAVGLGVRRLQQQPGRADRMAGGHGRRRGGGPADHPRRHQQRLPARRAGPRHRHLGRDRGAGGRGRPAGQRRRPRALLVGRGLPHRRPGRRPRSRRHAGLRPRVAGPRTRAGSTSPGCCCRSSPWPASSTGSSAAAPASPGRRPACSSRCSAAWCCSALFVWLQRRSTHPALDVSLFRNPAFSAAAAALGLNFFALMGATFYLVYFLQGLRGYSPLQSGSALIPVAIGMALMAAQSSRLAERFGAKAVCAAGFLLITLSFAGFQLLDETSPLWLLIVILSVQGLGMGSVMAPATESIMSVVPREKAGAGAAVNNAVRQIGGALGVAILGSVLAATYSAQLGRAVDVLPADARAEASQSIVATFEAVRRVEADRGRRRRPRGGDRRRAGPGGVRLGDARDRRRHGRRQPDRHRRRPRLAPGTAEPRGAGHSLTR